MHEYRRKKDFIFPGYAPNINVQNVYGPNNIFKDCTPYQGSDKLCILDKLIKVISGYEFITSIITKH